MVVLNFVFFIICCTNQFILLSFTSMLNAAGTAEKVKKEVSVISELGGQLMTYIVVICNCSLHVVLLFGGQNIYNFV